MHLVVARERDRPLKAAPLTRVQTVAAVGSGKVEGRPPERGMSAGETREDQLLPQDITATRQMKKVSCDLMFICLL